MSSCEWGLFGCQIDVECVASFGHYDFKFTGADVLVFLGDLDRVDRGETIEGNTIRSDDDFERSNGNLLGSGLALKCVLPVRFHCGSRHLSIFGQEQEASTVERLFVNGHCT